jgi:hypothetical protein
MLLIEAIEAMVERDRTLLSGAESNHERRSASPSPRGTQLKVRSAIKGGQR